MQHYRGNHAPPATEAWPAKKYIIFNKCQPGHSRKEGRPALPLPRTRPPDWRGAKAAWRRGALAPPGVSAALAPAFAPPQPTRPPPAHGIPAAAPGGLATATAAPVAAPAPQAASSGGAGAVADDPLAVGSSLQSLDSLGLDPTSSLLGTGTFADDLDDIDIPLLSPTSSAGAGAHSVAQEGPLSFGSLDLDLSMLPQMTV